MHLQELTDLPAGEVTSEFAARSHEYLLRECLFNDPSVEHEDRTIRDAPRLSRVMGNNHTL
jgi:hypothetical protein